MAGVVDGLVDAAMLQAGEGGIRPAGSSQAAAELERQDQMFAGRSAWGVPISDTHELGRVALLVASDSLQAYVSLAGGKREPVYAHLVVARAAIEASVNSAWLNQPGPAVTVEERARRGLVERYHAALQHGRVPELRAAADRVQEELKRIASALRWTLVTGESDEDLSIGGTRRPPAISGARQLLSTAMDEEAAARLWEHMTVVMQGSWHSLSAPPPPPLPPSPSLDPDWLDAAGGPERSQALALALALLQLYLRAAQSRAELMGWSSTSWNDARVRAEALAAQLADGLAGGAVRWG